MNLKTILTPTGLLEAGGALLVLLLGVYKKELGDLVKGWLKSWRRWLAQRFVARRLTDAELADILGSGLEGLETLLLFILNEYGADRVTVTEYTEQEDGSALATCLVEVRQAEMNSVRNLRNTPLPPPLWAEIKAIGLRYPGRVRYVQDVHFEESAAVRVALTASGAWSAYYHMMADPSGSYAHCHLLGLSWHQQHELGPERLAALHRSAVSCFAMLSLMEKLKAT